MRLITVTGGMEECSALCATYNLIPREIYRSFPPTWPPLFRALFAANNTLSMMDATVRTPPTMAQVLNVERWTCKQSDRIVINQTHEVRKCAKDCLVSECTTKRGEMS